MAVQIATAARGMTTDHVSVRFGIGTVAGWRRSIIAITASAMAALMMWINGLSAGVPVMLTGCTSWGTGANR